MPAHLNIGWGPPMPKGSWGGGGGGGVSDAVRAQCVYWGCSADGSASLEATASSWEPNNVHDMHVHFLFLYLCHVFCNVPLLVGL